MTSPEQSAAESLAEKVARAFQNSAHEYDDLIPSWDDLAPTHKSIAVRDIGDELEKLARVGFAVVELPEPADEKTYPASPLRSAKFGPVEARNFGLGGSWPWSLSWPGTFQDDPQQVREFAAGLLAGLEWCERLETERQGGEPR